MIGRWIYLRILGLCLSATFLSLANQLQGLAGPRGIFPSASAWSLRLLWIAGLAGSLLLLLNRLNRAGLLLCLAGLFWFVKAGSYFAWYKADNLLLEGTFLALFLAPKGNKPGLGEGDPPSRFVWWMHLWLLFRLMLETGLSKLYGGDRAWRDLSAMEYFFETSPFPAAGGWLFHQIGVPFPQIVTAYTLIVETVFAFFLFFDRRTTVAVVVAWVVLQTGILFSGNFMAFNYQAIGLSLLMIDDKVWQRFSPVSIEPSAPPAGKTWRSGAVQALLGIHWTVAMLLLMAFPNFPALRFPDGIGQVLAAAARTRVVNQYILFPSVQKERRVVFFEGSNDGGKTWLEYPMRWQPQRLDQMPRYFAPYQPRFDRELLRLTEGQDHLELRRSAFVLAVASRLIEGSRPVLDLFAGNPFPGMPPSRIRAVIYRYWFTDEDTLWDTGKWWERERIGLYGPEIERNPVGGLARYVQ